jgi:hypothetical protein
LPIADKPICYISIDFILELPPSKNRYKIVYNIVLVIVCRFTKYVLYIPYSTKTKAPELISIFIDRFYGDYGLPSSIVTNRGS